MIINPGLDAAHFDIFESDNDAPDPKEDEHHAIFACSDYVYARQLIQEMQDLFSGSISTVG